MRVSMLVRWGTALTAALMLAACSDTATAPPSAPAARPHLSDKQFEQWLLDNGGASRDGRGRSNKTDSVWAKTFVVDPTKATTIKVGDHSVYFPANSICDLSSSYGEDQWDQSCTPATSPITITATWNSKYGHAYVDFEPAMRFVPTSDPSQYVTLTMKDYYDINTNYSYPIYWYRPTDGLWVDESVNDPSLGSWEDLNGNKVTRRIKHFSGYLVSAGEVCDAWSDASCASVMSFAGFLVGY
jgi:hypothetical protein